MVRHLLAPAPGSYTIWARALGTPGGQAKITTCATDVTGPSLTATSAPRSTRSSSAAREEQLPERDDGAHDLTLDAVVDAAAVTACGGTTVGLFDRCLQGYFWQYDNNGLKLLQVRFYQNPA